MELRSRKRGPPAKKRQTTSAFKTPKFPASATDAEVGLAKLASHAARQEYRGNTPLPLYSAKEAAEDDSRVTKYESPFHTGVAGLSAQRFSIGSEPDPRKRDPQTTTNANDFPETRPLGAKYSDFLPKLKKRHIDHLSKQFKEDRKNPQEFELPSAPTQDDRIETMYQGVTQDSENHRGKMVGAKDFRGATHALADDPPELRAILKKEGAPVPRNPKIPLNLAKVMPFLAPSVAEGGGPHLMNLLSGTEKPGPSEAYVLRHYMSSDSDEEMPDIFSMQERQKRAKAPKRKAESEAETGSDVDEY